MPVWNYIVVAIVAYLLGSIPTGYLVAKAKGIDIRTVGSGNIGATNALRVLGKPAGIFVLLADCAKGYAAVWLCWFLMDHYIVVNLDRELAPIVAGICAVLGHNYTCWLKFKGGKGIATTAGVYLALAPLALGIAFAVFVVALLATRYVSVGSISAAIALPTTIWVMLWIQNRSPHGHVDDSIPVTSQEIFFGIVTTALGALAIYKHRANIKRLMNGTENRLGKKPSTEGTK
ncbi:MAG TPA: glycerol-3-phosphate 1-O-acyltransferase PlsY [Desulfuromonadaceae bacterium]|nr:glycerol-3-phosphate 1-O-acyltransferase PlsY [Desulfuromonadaceae bacterium]